MIESPKDRLVRFEKAINAIIAHPDNDSFSRLINPNRALFEGFRLTYSTKNLNANINQVSLKDIETEFPVITPFFGGSGLLFYEHNLYLEVIEKGKEETSIYFSISIDTQVAGAFRCYEDGKKPEDSDRFHSIISLVKNNGFNFDYTFYLTEDICHTYDLKNLRPFNTIRALKLFDNLDMNSYLNDPLIPVFNESRESAGIRANDAIISFQELTQTALIKRKGLLLVLLKATQLFWEYKNYSPEIFEKLIEYSISNLGGFAKLELYFGWKLLKYADTYKFFGPIRQPTEKGINKLNGMSWDMYMIRHQEKMASSSSRNHDFYIPLIATFDRRFQDLIKATPIRCLLVDDKGGHINTIFFDDAEFFSDISGSTSEELNKTMSNPVDKLKRFNRKDDEVSLDRELVRMKQECRSYIKC